MVVVPSLVRVNLVVSPEHLPEGQAVRRGRPPPQIPTTNGTTSPALRLTTQPIPSQGPLGFFPGDGFGSAPMAVLFVSLGATALSRDVNRPRRGPRSGPPADELRGAWEGAKAANDRDMTGVSNVVAPPRNPLLPRMLIHPRSPHERAVRRPRQRARRGSH